MTLIKSISGIRGTIGGATGDNLTPLDTVKFVTAYGLWLKENTSHKVNMKVVVGRDARLSGKMLEGLVVNTLIALGIDVVNLGLSTTPTVELAVTDLSADGGIILTASHNPKEWNALKLLNANGEFLSKSEGLKILEITSDESKLLYAQVDDLGTVTQSPNDYMSIHIDKVLKLPLVNVEGIKKLGLKVVVDAVNSTGGIVIPKLLEKLGVEVVRLYCEPTGHFPHNPEPLKENLLDISSKVLETSSDLGIVVDPDVDRLLFVCDNGEFFGEEYTIVACADYVLSKKKGSTVSNLSSTRALKDISQRYGCNYYSSAVGEVNVVEKMKTHNAIIGGEGNGGVIYPELHYGRDALVGVVLFLSLLAERKTTMSLLKETYPKYYMAKRKIILNSNLNADILLEGIAQRYNSENLNVIDGVKVDFEDSWVHLRTSNTEPIIRIYTEAKTEVQANSLADKIIEELDLV